MPLMLPLPTEGVSVAALFTNTGIDYFGPLYIKAKGDKQKVWVCLYTCLVTRAVHLELMQDMSAYKFLLGFRRYIARHGKPNKVTLKHYVYSVSNFRPLGLYQETN